MGTSRYSAAQTLGSSTTRATTVGTRTIGVSSSVLLVGTSFAGEITSPSREKGHPPLAVPFLQGTRPVGSASRAATCLIPTPIFARAIFCRQTWRFRRSAASRGEEDPETARRWFIGRRRDSATRGRLPFDIINLTLVKCEGVSGQSATNSEVRCRGGLTGLPNSRLRGHPFLNSHYSSLDVFLKNK